MGWCALHQAPLKTVRWTSARDVTAVPYHVLTRHRPQANVKPTMYLSTTRVHQYFAV